MLFLREDCVPIRSEQPVLSLSLFMTLLHEYDRLSQGPQVFPCPLSSLHSRVHSYDSDLYGSHDSLIVPAACRSSPLRSLNPSSSPLATTSPSNVPFVASVAEQVASLSPSPPSRATTLGFDARQPSSHAPLEQRVSLPG